MSSKNKFAEVALPVGTFTYEVPGEFREDIKIGTLVKVPFNVRTLDGWVVGLSEKPEYQENGNNSGESEPAHKGIKQLLKLNSAVPLISSELMKLAGWMADYYQSTIGFVLNLIVPPIDKKIPVIETQDSALLPDSLTGQKSPPVISEALKARKFKSILLQGSNRQAIYSRAINEALTYGRGVIFLVPEIDLASSTAAAMEKQFGKVVAVLHSGLKKTERWMEWLRIKSGETRIVVGTMSAVFAPVNKLGIIIVDEEYSKSYKSDKHPKYSALSVAAMRAKIESCLYMIGSSIPSIEALYNTESGKSTLLKVNPVRKSNRVSLVDMRDEADRIFSSQLKNVLRKHIESKGKILLFLNRRGFSSFILCEDCGYVPRCDKCGIALTYHKADTGGKNFFYCHYCGYKTEAFGCCPQCKGVNLSRKGLGTAQVERKFKNLFPETSIFRLDTDTVSRNYISHIFKAFESGKFQVLLGTQLVAKPLELPELSLLGVISADTFLHFPDFRAPERAYITLGNLIEKSAQSILQTCNPEHRVLKFLSEKDYNGFYNLEKSIRRELNYPPYSHLVEITLEARSEDTLQAKAEIIKEKLKELKLNFIGPSIEGNSKTFKLKVLIKTSNPALFSLHKMMPAGTKVDVDPVEFGF